jgi:hypothetical protein
MDLSYASKYGIDMVVEPNFWTGWPSIFIEKIQMSIISTNKNIFNFFIEHPHSLIVLYTYI